MSRLPDQGFSSEMARVLELLLPYNICVCFNHSPVWDGHNIHPPCEAVKLARKIVREKQ